ncbi:hypothetical protein HMPREF9057_00885 [Actinomyces sp. oral taxon 171 str. F0337]|nr:hypothetical protein HMPREF9057_00885 [Actinomyces sp. oral taxon 171 str. F0337]
MNELDSPHRRGTLALTMSEAAAGSGELFGQRSRPCEEEDS